MSTEPDPTHPAPSPAAHGRRYKQRELSCGGRHARPGRRRSIAQHDTDGTLAHTWAPDDPEWARHAIRFGLYPQDATVARPAATWTTCAARRDRRARPGAGMTARAGPTRRHGKGRTSSDGSDASAPAVACRRATDFTAARAALGLRAVPSRPPARPGARRRVPGVRRDRPSRPAPGLREEVAWPSGQPSSRSDGARPRLDPFGHRCQAERTPDLDDRTDDAVPRADR